MSPHSATCFSVLTMLLINTLNAQTGKGCAFTTCPTPGQVRIDAKFDTNQQYIGGCYCGCNPQLYNSSSSKYCDSPRVINFNPVTSSGDCSCECALPKPICHFPQTFDPIECECACPSFIQTSCSSPQIWRQELCMCSCDAGSVGGPCVANGQFIANSYVLPDCTCEYENKIQCPGMQEVDPTTGQCKCPSFMTDPSKVTCQSPQIWMPELCMCSCQIGSVGGPCIANGQFIANSNIMSDCTCDYGHGSPIVNPPITTNVNAAGVCYIRGEPCAKDAHCCSDICKISGYCW